MAINIFWREIITGFWFSYLGNHLVLVRKKCANPRDPFLLTPHIDSLLNVSCTNKSVQPTSPPINKHLCTFKLRNVFIHFTYYFSARHGLTNNDSSRGRWMFKKKKSEQYRPNRNSNNGAAANSNGAGNNTNLNSATNSDDNERNCMLNHVSNSFCCLCSTPNYV